MSSLLPQHERLVVASAITPEVAAARGYRSATSKAELKRLGFSDFQCRVPALLVPVFSVFGEVATYQIRPDDPRIDKKKGKALKYETVAGARMVIDVPPTARAKIGDPSVPLFVTEGVRKADSAVSRGLCCIDVLGVWNWRGTNADGGKTALGDWEAIALKERKVYLAFDSDYLEKMAVRQALTRLRIFCQSKGAHVQVLGLPPGDGGIKVGLDDFFAAGNSVKELLATVCDTAALGATDSDLEPTAGRFARPVLRILDADLHALTIQAWAAVEKGNTPPVTPTIFRHGDSIGRIERTDEGELRVAILRNDTMRRELVRLVEFQAFDKESEEFVHARPPCDLVANLLAWPEPPLPPLVRIAHVPVFDRNGRLIVAEGYDAKSALYVSIGSLKLPTISEHPSNAEIARALELIVSDLLGDFPFARPADRANAVAILLLPFVRELIDGPTPLHVIEKPSPGTGAGLLTEVLTIPALGRSPALMTEGRDEDEWRKRITAVLSHSPAFVVLDNLRNTLDSASLSAVLTATTWEDRLLGHSRMVLLPVRCTWIATANNPALSHEVARRSVPIHLDAQMDRPWERPRGCFKHPDLRRWALEHRGELVWAALVLIRAWLAEGQAAGNQPNLGSFEGYSSILGGVLHRAGIDGFLANLDDFYSRADQEGETWRGLLTAWWSYHGDAEIGTADVWSIVQHAEIDIGLGQGSEKALRTKLGILLRQMRDRRFRIVHELTHVEVRLDHPRDRQGVARYRLVRIHTGGPHGPGGPSHPLTVTEAGDGGGPRGHLDALPLQHARSPEDVSLSLADSDLGGRGPPGPPGPPPGSPNNGEREVYEL
jgi:hypothetical protein